MIKSDEVLPSLDSFCNWKLLDNGHSCARQESEAKYHNPFAREFKKTIYALLDLQLQVNLGLQNNAHSLIITHNVEGFVTNPRYEEWTNHEISF